MESAKNWKRVVALFVDLAIVDFIITRPLSKLVDVKEVSSLGEIWTLLSLNNLVWISLLMGLLGVMYWSILEYKIGQTLGGVIFNLRMKTLDGKRGDFSQVFLRNVTKVSMALLVLDAVYVFFSPQRQRFFEHLSKTRTIEGGRERE